MRKERESDAQTARDHGNEELSKETNDDRMEKEFDEWMERLSEGVTKMKAIGGKN